MCFCCMNYKKTVKLSMYGKYQLFKNLTDKKDPDNHSVKLEVWQNGSRSLLD